MDSQPETAGKVGQDYARLRELAEKATRGRWQNGIDDLEGVVAPDNPGLGNVICLPPKRNMYSSLECWPDNAAFIAAANPATFLQLLADNERMRAGLERAADDLRDIGGQNPRPSNSSDPEHENYLRRVLISLAQVGNTRARAALNPIQTTGDHHAR